MTERVLARKVLQRVSAEMGKGSVEGGWITTISLTRSPGAKLAPFSGQGGSRDLSDGPGAIQDVSKTGPERSKRSKDGLKTVQEGSKTAQEVLKRTPERA